MTVFYLILGILLIIFYIFATPAAIKGTLNLMLLGLAVVLLVTLLILLVMQVTQSPLELWVSLAMTFLGIWALWDIARMDKKGAYPRSAADRESFWRRFF